MSSAEAKLIATLAAHRIRVRQNLQKLTQELERRSLAHDLSKYGDDELDGFVEINRAAREHPYDSPEYRAALANPCVKNHYKKNSHHPEFHADPHWECSGCFRITQEKPKESCPVCGYSSTNVLVDARSMTLFDIVEMVCDWKAAADTYGKTTLREGLEKQKTKILLTKWQWGMVESLAGFLEPNMQGEERGGREPQMNADGAAG